MEHVLSACQNKVSVTYQQQTLHQLSYLCYLFPQARIVFFITLLILIYLVFADDHEKAEEINGKLIHLVHLNLQGVICNSKEM